MRVFVSVFCLVLLGANVSFALTGSRNIVTSVEQRKQNEMHEKERELAERVAAATVEQIRHKFNQDVDTLKARTQCRDELALEAAKDAKYLAQRQSNLSVRLKQSLKFEEQCEPNSFKSEG